MEQKSDSPKLPDMVMCGDHPSITKTELNAKEKIDEKKSALHAKLSPTSSRTFATGGGGGGGGGEHRLRAASEHALRLIEARRRVRSLDAVQRPDDPGAPNRALVQAALGSFRWPPYLLAVWVVVLILTHALHCIVSVLDRALPNIKTMSQYFRTWTEDSWRACADREPPQRVLAALLAALTGLMYAVYCVLYTVHAVALWAVEPLAADLDDKASEMDAKVTDYDEIAGIVKH